MPEIAATDMRVLLASRAKGWLNDLGGGWYTLINTHTQIHTWTNVNGYELECWPTSECPFECLGTEKSAVLSDYHWFLLEVNMKRDLKEIIFRFLNGKTSNEHLWVLCFNIRAGTGNKRSLQTAKVSMMVPWTPYLEMEARSQCPKQLCSSCWKLAAEMKTKQGGEWLRWLVPSQE